MYKRSQILPKRSRNSSAIVWLPLTNSSARFCAGVLPELFALFSAREQKLSRLDRLNPRS
ncbi:hypothetical protein [Leptolyngbya sp. AN10]|uniref:hypothetical protein n=1 Tax=Leptolyngbya sp. AN10 TaxID=3423365 RepID=UPI003D31E886